MESVSERPDTFFRLSPAGSGKVRYFAVRRGDVNQVANVTVLLSEHYGDLKALSLCQYPLGSVGDMLSVVQDGLHGVRNYVADGVPLLGVGNVTEEGIDLSEVKRITFEEHERLAASQVAYGDLLVTITGRLGTAALYNSTEPANLSAHVALCRGKPQHELRYLQHYLASRLGAASLTKATIGSTHPHINVNRLAELPIPLPSRIKQREISDKMDVARADWKAKLEEANSLLAGLDGFLLDALGIIPPPEDSRRVFAVCLAQIRENRSLDADYYHPERILALRPLSNSAQALTITQLATVADFEREQVRTPGENYLSLAHVQGHTGELSDSRETAKGTCFIYQTEDILFARLRPYLNKVYRAEMDGCCSTEFHVLRVKNSKALLPDYLAAVLRSRLILAQTTHMMTGNTHPRLRNDDAANLKIPIPRLEIQEAIVAEVRRRRDEARRLHAEAEADWQVAKLWFEEQLLGPTSP